MLKQRFFLKAFFFTTIMIVGSFVKNGVSQSKSLTQTVAQNNSTGDALVKKYARMLQVSEAEIIPFRGLYAFIDNWMGTPYLWGGCSKKGIDCSCFVMTLFEDVYNINIQRTSFTQFYDKDVALFRNRNQYSTGDLIFFKTNVNRETRNNRITHVGFYLTNGYFVQSSSKGVNIASLKNGFWKSCTVAAGRLKESYYKEARMVVPGGEIQANNLQFKAEMDSYFEPPLMNERYDAIIKKYAAILSVTEEEIQVPEVLEYIDNNNQQIFSIKNCVPGSNPSTCMVGDLYENVFGVNVETSLFPMQNSSTIYTLRQGVDSLVIGDLVFLKTSPRLSYYDKAGVYLHNKQFVHIEKGRMVISNLNEPGIKQLRKLYGRYKNDVYEIAGKNLKARRDYEDSIARENTQALVSIDQKTKGTDDVSKSPADGDKNNPVKILASPNSVKWAEKSFEDFVPPFIVPYDPGNEKQYPEFANINAKMLNVHQGFIKDSLLYAFADKWNRAPYRKRGCSIDGINEKCFIEKYYEEVLQRNISVSTLEEIYQYHSLPLRKEDVFTEGDLLFFGEKNQDGATVVTFGGIYINGRYFLALSPVTKMVEIFSVKEEFFKTKFINAAKPGLK